jgi:hypothetical protein
VSFYVASNHRVLPYALPYFARISLLRTPFSMSLYSLESLWNYTQDYGKILSIWPIFERRNKVAPTVPRFILSPTSLPFGILAITLCSELRFGRSCTCWKAYETFYKIMKKCWAFEHVLSVGWNDDGVGSSGASHFRTNTSLYVSRKSIGWTDAIIRWYHQIIRCLYACFLLLRSSSGAHKNGTVGSSYALFSAHLNLGITFHSGFRFWWSWTLWKACGIIFMIL